MIKTLSIVIPALNEERTIGPVIEKVMAQDLPEPWNKEIIVINDGSTDRTEESLRPHLAKIKYIKHPENRGKGAAIRTAIEHASGHAVIIQDADLEYSPDEFPALLAELDSYPDHAAVYGSRNIHPDRQGYTTFVWGVAVLTFVNNLLYGSRLTDTYTCYKLFRTPVLKSIPLASRGFEFEAEITAKLLRHGHKIREIPIRYVPRSFAEGKKIRWQDGVRGLWTIIKYRF